MAKPTFEERVRMLIRNMWNDDIGRSKDELMAVENDGDFFKVAVETEYVMIHKSHFEDYFKALDGKDKPKRKAHAESIRNYLKQLVG
jgi:hypothetical protein